VRLAGGILADRSCCVADVSRAACATGAFGNGETVCGRRFVAVSGALLFGCQLKSKVSSNSIVSTQ